MGFFSKITKPFKKVIHKITGDYSATGDSTPAPELALVDPDGEAEKMEETKKVQLRKGKKGLRIKKAGSAEVSAGTGRNLV